MKIWPGVLFLGTIDSTSFVICSQNTRVGIEVIHSVIGDEYFCVFAELQNIVGNPYIVVYE